MAKSVEIAIRRAIEELLALADVADRFGGGVSAQAVRDVANELAMRDAAPSLPPVEAQLRETVNRWRANAESLFKNGSDEQFTVAHTQQFCANELEAVIAAIPSPQTWQPIETAPKDGKDILLFDAKAKIVTYGGWVSEIDQGADYEGQGIVSAGWWSIDLSDNRPTHWMPLPDPPAVAAPRGGPDPQEPCATLWAQASAKIENP